jgi:hypothetical protein
MCRAVQCRICGKTTWSGCGLHVDAVKRTVPPEHWCDGPIRAHRANCGGGAVAFEPD